MAFTTKQARMKRYQKSIRGILAKHFYDDKEIPSEDERTWNDFVDKFNAAGSNKYKNIFDDSNVRTCFKARAITGFLAIDTKYSPFAFFKTDMKGCLVRFWLNSELCVELKHFPTELQLFVFDLILLNFKEMENHPGAEISVCEEEFQKLILQALDCERSFGCAQGIQLFDLYRLKDKTPFVGVEDSSGYEPLYKLLISDVLPIWKMEAHSSMMRIIDDEESGRVKPRAEHERALKCYLKILGHLVPSVEERTYGQGMLETQVGEVLKFCKVNHFSPYTVGRILDALPTGNTKQRFVIMVVNSIDGLFQTPFGINNQTDYDLAVKIRKYLSFEGDGSSDAMAVIAKLEKMMCEASAKFREHGDKKILQARRDELLFSKLY